MRLLNPPLYSKQTLTSAATALLMCLAWPVAAGPGAHGPNGEHLEAPSAMRTGSALPRITAQSDTFELVAELRPTELTVFIDRFESNEPVLAAKLELESGTLKAVAAFRADRGDYAVTDAVMLKALNAPGEHGLVFTLVAGSSSDLLDGTLAVNAPSAASTMAQSEMGRLNKTNAGHKNTGLQIALWVGAAVAALGLLGGMAWWRQRRNPVGKFKGGL